MERFLLRKWSDDEENKRILKLRALKEITLNRFSPEIRNTINILFDELVCEVIFQIHMEYKSRLADPKWYNRLSPTYDETLINMANNLNINKVNQDVDCPKCYVQVKCLWLSKHLAGCMNPQQSTYSYSSRNSSRIARQRIQEGFKTSYDESKLDSDDDRRTKPKKRNNKAKKTTKIKNVK